MQPISKNKIKWIRTLHQKKFRDLENCFIIEGKKSVLEALEKMPKMIKTIILETNESIADIPEHIEVQTASRLDFEKISTLKTPQPCLAVIEKLPPSMSGKNGLILVLDNIQDPGNFGTIIRLADWFGVEHIICSENTVDVYNPKVIQATMGSIFRVKVHYKNLPKYLNTVKLPIYGALLEGENIYKETLPTDALLVLGNEGNGISEEIKTFIQHPITIPRFGAAESLNVSMASAILLSEFKRG
jgi:TrmH family RNA methyltransferase